MLNICQEYFDEHKNIISTNIVVAKTKTKCMIFGSKFRTKPFPIKYNDQELPWWDQTWPHLGHLFHEDQSSDHDLLQKRAKFIGKLHSMRQEFGNKDPIVYIQLVSIYLTSFYGSNLWDLFGEACQKHLKSWNIMIRYTFDIPRETHKYLLETISETSHLKNKLVERFITFSKMISKCDKSHIRYLHSLQKSDQRSVYGRNVANICSEAKVEELSEVDLSQIVYEKIPESELWRNTVIAELLEMRAGRAKTELTAEETLILLNSLCKS